MIDYKTALSPEELPLEQLKKGHTSLQAKEEWQNETIYFMLDDINISINRLDNILDHWWNNLPLTAKWQIYTTHSLRGIKMPQQWIVMWRVILKQPNLRDPERATKMGSHVGSDNHLWNLWTKDCLIKFLTPMEKRIIRLRDEGMSNLEIGCQMIAEYGDKFYKPRQATKEGNNKGTTDPAKVINYWFSDKMPRRLAKQTILEYVSRK